MARFVVSDHHFGYADIIDDCDRPFSSPGEMEDILLSRHHEAVGSDDTLLHLGADGGPFGGGLLRSGSTGDRTADLNCPGSPVETTSGWSHISLHGQVRHR